VRLADTHGSTTHDLIQIAVIRKHRSDLHRWRATLRHDNAAVPPAQSSGHLAANCRIAFHRATVPGPGTLRRPVAERQRSRGAASDASAKCEFLETDLHGLKFDVDNLAEVLHAEGRQTMPDLIRGLLELNARWEGKTRWGDKTPYYVLNIPKILEWFPDAQIVHLIRDGRDVALSMFGRRHDFYVYNTYHAAKYWQQYVERGREYGRALRDDQYFELRYEDMLADPEQEMKRLCAFLNEDYDSTLFDVAPNATPGKTPLVHKPIKAENANKWRERMTSYQV
jgi:hypothetical protein